MGYAQLVIGPAGSGKVRTRFLSITSYHNAFVYCLFIRLLYHISSCKIV